MSYPVQTLLDMVNSILVDMGRGRVNDLGQTPEADRVESIAKDVYYQFISRKLWPNKRQLTELESLSDLSRRTCLKVPNSVSRVEEISYNTGTLAQPTWRSLCYLEPEEFAARLLGNPSDQAEYTSTEIDSVTMFIRNDGAPSYWTSFDDETIILDSYDRTKEDTVQGSKTAAWVYSEPSWPLTKDDRVDIPARYYPTYLALVKSTATEKIKKEQSQADLYWGRAGMARLLAEEKVNGTNRTEKRKRYGRRGPY